jgi:hypothetical protein
MAWGVTVIELSMNLDSKESLVRRMSIRRIRSVQAATIAVATTVVVIAGGAPAQADYYAGGMPGRTFSVKTVGINDTWVGIFDDARSRWNNAGVSANIGRSSSAAATFTANNYSNQTWFGLYSPRGERYADRAFGIQVNTYQLRQLAGSHFSEWCDSTTTHEIGHALSLGDNPNTSKASLMKHDRNRTTVFSPTSYDKSEVKRIYS